MSPGGSSAEGGQLESAEGGQPEAWGAAEEAPAQEQELEEVTAGKERKGRTRCARSVAAAVPDSMDFGAADTLQKLRHKLTAQGKQHLESYAADWEMGASGGEVSRAWFRLPQGRTIKTFSAAIKALEDARAAHQGISAPHSGKTLLICYLPSYPCPNMTPLDGISLPKRFK